jgi:hypothetical protein
VPDSWVALCSPRLQTAGHCTSDIVEGDTLLMCHDPILRRSADEEPGPVKGVKLQRHFRCSSKSRAGTKDCCARRRAGPRGARRGRMADVQESVWTWTEQRIRHGHPYALSRVTRITRRNRHILTRHHTVPLGPAGGSRSFMFLRRSYGFRDEPSDALRRFRERRPLVS